MNLNIGERSDGSPFSLPIDAATARIVAIGKSGAGKTNADAVFIEEIYRAGVAPIVLDPLGNMWGLRSSADGQSAGIPVAIFGGQHADAPLPVDRAEYMAELVAEGVPSVFDLSEMPTEELVEFAGEFLPALLREAMRHRRNLFVVMEEADRFARNTGKTSPVTQWARAARNAGIGWMFSTHKPQIVHKEIIDTASVFIAMKMTGELAQDAIGGEIGSRIGKRTANSLIADLPRCGRGDAWFVPDPDWLNDGRDWEPERIHFRLRDTFHVQPPRVGEERYEPKVLADVDRERLREALAAEIDAQKADDPETLRSRIQELEEHLAQKSVNNVAEKVRTETVERIVEVPALAPDVIEQLRGVLSDLGRTADRFASMTGEVTNAMDRLAHLSETVSSGFERVNQQRSGDLESVQKSTGKYREVRTTPPQSATDRRRNDADGDRLATAQGDLGAAPSAVLEALASFKGGHATRRQVAALTGYSVRKSTLRNALSVLRTRELIETAGDDVVLTPAGRKLAGPPPAPKTTAETIAMWRAKLEAAPLAILDALIDAYPNALSREEAGNRAGVDHTKSTLRNALSRLRVQGLIAENGTGLRASDELFPTGALR